MIDECFLVAKSPFAQISSKGSQRMGFFSWPTVPFRSSAVRRPQLRLPMRSEALSLMESENIFMQGIVNGECFLVHRGLRVVPPQIMYSSNKTGFAAKRDVKLMIGAMSNASSEDTQSSKVAHGPRCIPLFKLANEHRTYDNDQDDNTTNEPTSETGKI